MAITPLASSGFEAGCNPVPGSNATGGLAHVGTTIARSSARGSGFGARVVSPLNTAAGITFAFATATRVVLRVAFRNTVRPGGSYGQLVSFNANAGAIAGGVVMNAAGQIFIVPQNGGTPAGGNTVDQDWHVLEVHADYTQTFNTFDWRIDGVPQTQVVGTAQTGGMNNITLGNANAIWQTSTFDFDDFVLGTWTDATNDWYGDGRGLAHIAAADGVHSFTTGDFGLDDAGATQASTFQNFFLQVNDAPGANGWTTTRNNNISQRVARTTGYVEIMPDQNIVEVGPANGVTACLSYSSSGTTANNAGCIARNGDGSAVAIFGDLPVAQGGLGGALADYSESTNFFVGSQVPVPSGLWTPDQVEAVRWRFGGSTDVSPLPTVQALMLDVDWPLNGARFVKATPPGRVPIGA